ncbi:MAG: cysteine desulfurase family protein [Chloroflexota bacterium]
MPTSSPIYLDHAATTPLDPAVLEVMLPYFSERFGNASSVYRLGREARRALDRARQQVAAVLHCPPTDIVFTSGGSEGDNAAIKGAVFARGARGRHIVTSAIEHEAVLHTCQALAGFGVETTVVPVDRDGRVMPEAVAAAIRPDTALVTIMLANNEVGTLQPVAEIAELAHRQGILVHTDAVQAAGAQSLDVQALGVDLLSLSGHKFYGPKGTGALYVRSGSAWAPQQQGGSQEGKRRAGTENVAGIVGLATALTRAEAERECEAVRLAALRDRLIRGVLARIPDSRLTGHPTLRLPNNVSFVFAGVEGEAILMALDVQGIAASTGSACTSASLDPSHVLLALGLPAPLALGSLRLTLGRSNSDADVDRVVELLPAIVQRQRAMQSLATA